MLTADGAHRDGQQPCRGIAQPTRTAGIRCSCQGAEIWLSSSSGMTLAQSGAPGGALQRTACTPPGHVDHRGRLSPTVCSVRRAGYRRAGRGLTRFAQPWSRNDRRSEGGGAQASCGRSGIRPAAGEPVGEASCGGLVGRSGELQGMFVANAHSFQPPAHLGRVQ
jgi:hypothetical protein